MLYRYVYTCLCTHAQSVYARQSLESVDRGAWRWSCEYTTIISQCNA